MGFDVVVWHREFSAASLAGTALVLAPTAWLLRRAGEATASVAVGRRVPVASCKAGAAEST